MTQNLLSGGRRERLEGWGRHPRLYAESHLIQERAHAAPLLLALRERGPALAYGLGRSYGDAALTCEGIALKTRPLNRVLSFDPETGWIKVEAGVSIADLIQRYLPLGYFPPVVPGTQFVTIGGAIANDIHGKNHHLDGTIADHIRSVELLLASGEVVHCDATTRSELFWATVGGLGLTGLILSVELRLTSVGGPGIEMESIQVRDLDHFFEVSADSKGFTHTVSWIDCSKRGAGMGRGIYMRGRHSDAPPKPRLLGKIAGAISPLMRVPFSMPNLMLNPLTVRAFNELYFRKHPAGSLEQITHYEPFFFPLDFVKRWNLIYGRRGFLQYQLVVPKSPNHRAIREILTAISEAGMGSFLAVIKEFGDRQHPHLSFPMPGVTLALDFPNYGPELLALLSRLDRVVIEAGGRVYLGKDARLPREHFVEMYPAWEEWRAQKMRWDPEQRFRSSLSERLGLTKG